jgi:hypothetical protein
MIALRHALSPIPVLQNLKVETVHLAPILLASFGVGTEQNLEILSSDIKQSLKCTVQYRYPKKILFDMIRKM